MAARLDNRHLGERLADGQLSGCTSGCGTIGYDSAGRTSALNGWTFLYDSAGRLTSACHSGSCSRGGFDRLGMTYDGEGHRTRLKTTSVAGDDLIIEIVGIECIARDLRATRPD